MSEKQRGMKGHILRTERAKENTENTHISAQTLMTSPQFVYLWKLVYKNKTPTGKRDDKSLRKKKRGSEGI